MKEIRRLVWGLVLILLGVVIGLNSLGITDINLFFRGWWTLFIIVPSFIGLFFDEDKSGNLIGIVIGVLLLLGVRDIISFSMIRKMIVPIVLVLVGCSLIFNECIKGHISDKVRKNNSGKTDYYTSTFSEQKIDKSGEDFESANIDAVFGGVTLDLKEAKLKKDATIKASAIFGGITIKVPDGVNVKVHSTPIFGGVNQKAKIDKDSKNTIYIDAFCMFGGIEIK